ncbi:MAG: phytanoyl-CoA dioxygenase family protein [Pseudomonadota bacterium]
MSNAYNLSLAQKSFYADNGYLLLKSVFSRDEAAHFREEGHHVFNRLAAADIKVQSQGWRSGAKITDLPRALMSCHNVQFHSAAFTRLLTDPRLTDPIADLIGPNIQLHHTKLFIKPPEKGAPFPMHQDAPYFPHTRNTMTAAIIHFDDAPLEKGCVRVMPGSHRRGQRSHDVVEGTHEHHLEVDKFPLEDGVPCPAEAGDVLIFSYLMIHGSGRNESDEARTTLLVQVRDPEDLPRVDTHVSRGQGMMLRGIDPLANSGVTVPSPRRIVAPAPNVK